MRARPAVYTEFSPSLGDEENWPRGRPRFWFVFIRYDERLFRKGPYPWRVLATFVGSGYEWRLPGLVSVERAYLTRPDIAFILIWPVFVVVVSWTVSGLL
jgi:hypothetical protein